MHTEEELNCRIDEIVAMADRQALIRSFVRKNAIVYTIFSTVIFSIFALIPLSTGNLAIMMLAIPAPLVLGSSLGAFLSFLDCRKVTNRTLVSEASLDLFPMGLQPEILEIRKTLRVLNLSFRSNKRSDIAPVPLGSWADTANSYGSVLDEFEEYSLDIVKILDKPLILDMSSEFTRNFHISLNHAKQLKPTDGALYNPLHPFVKAVSELRFNWDALNSEAERVRLSRFTPKEVEGINRAKQMFSVALNSSATPAERQVAYKRALKELEGLIDVPPIAVFKLEASVTRRAIENIKR